MSTGYNGRIKFFFFPSRYFIFQSVNIFQFTLGQRCNRLLSFFLSLFFSRAIFFFCLFYSEFRQIFRKLDFFPPPMIRNGAEQNSYPIRNSTFRRDARNRFTPLENRDFHRSTVRVILQIGSFLRSLFFPLSFFNFLLPLSLPPPPPPIGGKLLSNSGTKL